MNTKLTDDASSFGQVWNAHKPIGDLNNLIEEIRPYGITMHAKKSEMLRYFSNGQRQCYLIEKGSVALHRRGDGMVLTSESAPFILGVSNQLSKNELVYVRALEEVKYSKLPLERFNLLVERANLWKSLAHHLIYTASRVLEQSTQMTQMSSYSIIRFQLCELMQEPASIRLNTTAANYIKGRTFLSRSGIMRILADLRNAGYISVERGILISMSSLPAQY
jgi:CRP-like cAMP-binding protein